MYIFTANQVNQVYVLKDNSTVVTNLDATHQITKANNVGSIGVGVTPDGKSLYFKHLGAGGVTRSDLIDIDKILYAKATPASAMARKLKAVKVTLNTQAVSSSAPIVGQDYILRLKFQNPVGMSPDNQYWKYGVVHVTAGMTAAQFMTKMAESINKNMAREAVKLVEATASGTTLTIKEVAQDWIRGIKQDKPLIFTAEPTWVNNGTEEVIWGDTVDSNGVKTTGGAAPAIGKDTPVATTTVGNGKLMADYEYFYMGERGDQYRMVNWPNYVPTDYLVDETLTYDTIAIHFAYVGANHAVQKSEKDITIVVPSGVTVGTGNDAVSLTNTIIGAINTAAGSTIIQTLS